MNKAPTISEQEELIERLKWRDDDVVAILYYENPDDSYYRMELTRKEAGEKRAWSHQVMLDSQQQINLMAFLDADGNLYKP